MSNDATLCVTGEDADAIALEVEEVEDRITGEDADAIALEVEEVEDTPQRLAEWNDDHLF